MKHNIAPALIDQAVPIDSLEAHPGNPRRRDAHARSVLVESLQEHGQFRAVVARRLRGGKRLQLLAGHGTVEAARELGWTHVAVGVLSGVGDVEAAKIVAVDNRASDLAGYDDRALVDLLLSFSDDLVGSGYSVGEMDALVDSLTGSGVGDSADILGDTEDNYSEQYGVIVLCDNAEMQEGVYNRLSGEFQRVRVVTV